MKHLPLFRICIQVLVIVLFCLLPVLHMYGFDGFKGSMFAFDIFGFPFADPASAAQASVGALRTAELPLTTFFAGVLVTLCIALLLGRIFCGWVCPYGFFSDMVSKWRSYPLPHAKKEFQFKSLILIISLCVAAIFAYPLVTLLSMPGQLSLLPQLIWLKPGWLALVALIAIPFFALFIEAITGKRLWCRFACPQSVFLGLAASAIPSKTPALRILWQNKRCTCGKNAPCRDACKLGLNPRHKDGPQRRDCTMCGDCVTQCARHGKALKFGFNRIAANKKTQPKPGSKFVSE